MISGRSTPCSGLPRSRRYDELVECLERRRSSPVNPSWCSGCCTGQGRSSTSGRRRERRQAALPAGARDRPAFVPALASLGRIYYRAGTGTTCWRCTAGSSRPRPGTAPARRAGDKDGRAVRAAAGQACRGPRLLPAGGRHRAWVPPGRARARAAAARDGRIRRAGRAAGETPGGAARSAARAQTWYRIGELHEERLDNPAQAIQFHAGPGRGAGLSPGGGGDRAAARGRRTVGPSWCSTSKRRRAPPPMADERPACC